MTSFHLYSLAPIVVVIGIAALAAYAEIRRRRAQKENLRKIARSLGFSFSEPKARSDFLRLIGEWEIKGRLHGVEVRIYGKKPPGSRSESTFIDATANCRRKCGLLIARETTASRLGQALLGLQDITTGNSELDRLVVVKGVPIHVVKSIVDHDGLQRALVELFQHEGFIHVDQHGAHYQGSRVVADETTLRRTLDALAKTAAELENATA